MSTRACVVCGRPASDDHHVSGRQLDPELSFWHCHNHHELMHDDWNTAGVPAKSQKRDDDQHAPPTRLHAIQTALQRLAMWLGRLHTADICTPLLGPLAAAVERWATILRGCIDALDASQPGWRESPGLGW
jgi:hypothetical protein